MKAILLIRVSHGLGVLLSAIQSTAENESAAMLLVSLNRLG
jgi:hypothetical protein